MTPPLFAERVLPTGFWMYLRDTKRQAMTALRHLSTPPGVPHE